MTTTHQPGHGIDVFRRICENLKSLHLRQWFLFFFVVVLSSKVLCLSRHSSVAECYVGVVATQLMDASPEVGLGEISTGETPQGSAKRNLPANEQETIAGKPPFLL